MQISKSSPLVASHKTIRVTEKNIFSVTGIIPFSLLDGSVKMEQDFYEALGEVLELGQFDSGLPKDKPEYLINGCFFAPNAEPVEAGYVQAQVGHLSKKLLVSGERFWQLGGLPSKPSKFVSLPLLPNYAFGGEGYSLNLKGKGYHADEEGVHWLPNIEYPLSLVTSKSAEGKPAFFSQTSVQDMPRAKLLGPVDADDDPYALPKDINWLYFNDAPTDQWFDAPLTGQERYHFQNMHPKFAMLSGELPTWRCRAFAKRALNTLGEQAAIENSQIDEIPMVLDTLWFCPHKELGALVFHGSMGVSDRFATDVKHLLLAFEDVDDHSRDKAWYERALRNRENDELALKFMLYCRDIIPESVELESDSDDDDPDALQDFMTGNIDSFVDSMEAQVMSDVAKQAAETHKQLLESGVVENLEAAMAPTVKSIKALEAQGAQLSAADKALLDKLKAEQKPLKEKLLKLKETIAFQALMAKDVQAALASKQVDDPELQKLMDFIASITPMRKDKPSEIDLAAVDLKKLDQLDEKIAAYMATQMAAILPDVQQQFTEGKAQLDNALQEVTKLKAEAPEKAEEAEQELLAAKEKLESSEQDVLAMLSGEDKPSELIRPPAADSLDDAEQQVKQQISETEQQLAGLAQLIEEQVGALQSQLAQLPAESEQAQQLSAEISELQNKLDSEDILEKLNEALAAIQQQKVELDENVPELKSAYAMGAHAMAEGLSPHLLPVTEVQKQFTAKRLAVESLHDGDWACLSFNGEQWLQVDVSFSYFEQTEFSHCTFTDVTFDKAILARAKFTDCHFERCTFNEATLGASEINACTFKGCEFKQAILSNAKISKTQFIECQLHDNDSLEIAMSQVLFTRSEVHDLNFIESELTQCGFVESSVKDCVFIETKAPALLCQNSQLSSLVFTDVQFEQADFSGCNMAVVAFFGDSDLSGANFSKIMGETVNLAGAKLSGANFKGADITMGYFAECNFSHADLSKTVLRGANFSFANLQDANLHSADLMEANFTGARLVSANFRLSHLFNALFLEATLGDTHFAGADLSQTLLEEYRP